MAVDWHTHAQQQYVRLNDAKKNHIFHLFVNKNAFFAIFLFQELNRFTQKH